VTGRYPSYAGMLCQLALFALLAGISYGQTATCGVPAIKPKGGTRVVGGVQATPGSWPWMVMLKEQGDHVCGGSLISEQWVLTAAHCFDGWGSKNAKRWRMLLGKHDKKKNEATQQNLAVSKIIVIPSYDEYTVEADIALVKLASPAKLNDRVRTVCLPSTASQLSVGKMCAVTGWGDTKGTGKARYLNQVSVPVIADTQCSNNRWYGKEFFPGPMFCAGYAAGKKDACTGDSGGPLMCATNGVWTVDGITSWGDDCARARKPGVYTNVRKYVSWIEKTMRSN